MLKHVLLVGEGIIKGKVSKKSRLHGCTERIRGTGN